MPLIQSPERAAYRTDTVVIGAGQAGLAAAYYLREAGVECILLDKEAAVGQVWATRYESLRLFSPAWASSLPGLGWGGSPLRYPTKDEAAAYLQRYAAHFDFDIHLRQRVVRLGAVGENGFEVLTQAGTRYVARRVVVCTGAFHARRVPAWAGELAPEVAQLHSRDYRFPEQFPAEGPLAVVGSGNSALQIAADLAASGRPVYMAYDEKTPALPNNTLVWALLRVSGLLRVSRHRGLGARLQARPEPVVSADLKRLQRHPQVRWIGRAQAAEGATLRGATASTPPLAAVIWATGFRSDFGWIDLPALDSQGMPRHHRGLSPVPGLAFLGLPWLDTRSSALMGGVGHDARRVVRQLLAREAVPVKN